MHRAGGGARGERSRRWVVGEAAVHRWRVLLRVQRVLDACHASGRGARRGAAHRRRAVDVRIECRHNHYRSTVECAAGRAAAAAAAAAAALVAEAASVVGRAFPCGEREGDGGAAFGGARGGAEGDERRRSVWREAEGGAAEPACH